MQLIDSHCHLDIPRFEQVVDLLIDEAKQAGVDRFILPGVARSGWNRLLKLCSEHEGLYGAPGLHPMYLSHHKPGDIDSLSQLVEHEKTIAIGEIGLDYFRGKETADQQQQLFEEQLALAKKRNKPVLLHVRKAHDQVLATLRRKHFHHGGIVHAFSGSYQQATQYIELGFLIGVAGTITYERARKTRQTMATLPLNALVLETDSPDLPLFGRQGKPNIPSHLPEIAAHLAALRGESLESIARATTANCIRALKLPDA